MSAHTPGPWAADVTGHGNHAGGFAIETRHRMVICGRAGWPSNADESRANALLIAAAPELLAALKSLRAEVVGAIGIGVAESIGHTNACCLGDKCQVAYEAIAKAEEML